MFSLDSQKEAVISVPERFPTMGNDLPQCTTISHGGERLVTQAALLKPVIPDPMDVFSMLYKEAKNPGICLFDIPLEAELPPSSLIESLSNVGQPLTGGRYKGTFGVEANAHVVVFSNKAPPDSLSHREVWLLRVSAPDDEPRWQFPFRRPEDQDAAAAAAVRSAAVPLPEDAAAAGALGAGVARCAMQ